MIFWENIVLLNFWEANVKRLYYINWQKQVFETDNAVDTVDLDVKKHLVS